MNKNPNVNTILRYLKNEKLNDIFNANMDNIQPFINDIKNDVISALSMSEENWNACREHISAYIKAIKTIDFLYKKNTDIYNQLFNCTNKQDVMNLLVNISSPYNNSHKICKYIIKEIKSKKKDKNSDTVTTNIESTSINFNNHKDINQNTVTKKNLKLDELKKLICKDKVLSKQLLDATDEEIHSIISLKFQDKYILSNDLIDEYIKTYCDSTSIETSDIIEINKIALINEEYSNKINALIEELDEIKNENLNLSKENDLLNSQLEVIQNALEKAKNQIEEYKSKNDNKQLRNVLSVNENDLITVLNNTSDYSTIKIRNSRLDQAFEIVNKFSLIKIEDVRKYNIDINSSVGELVYSYFINQNSFD